MEELAYAYHNGFDYVDHIDEEELMDVVKQLHENRLEIQSKSSIKSSTSLPEDAK